MIEFFSSVWLGIVNNKDAIIAVLTSAEFVGLCMLLRGIFKNNNSTRNNSLSNAALSLDLKNTITSLDNASNVITSVDDKLTAVDSDLASLKSQQNDIIERETLLLRKLDAVLEVQQIVYSTLKNDASRETVAALITEALHSDTLEKIKLHNELQELRSNIANAAASLTDTVTQTVEKAETIMHVSEEIHSPITRS